MANEEKPLLTTQAVPYLTSEFPGVGGVIKRFNEDFVVEEIPLYPASGEGTHVFFLIEKESLTTLAALEVAARALGKGRREIGYAGLKDAHGVTRQWFSAEHVSEEKVRAIQTARLRVIEVTRHTNKIKLGHLGGNRFEIRIRDVDKTALPMAKRVMQSLEAKGIPNYFGPQRFGVRGDNAQIGAAALRGDYDEAVALVLGRPGAIDRGPALRARELFDAGDVEGSAEIWRRGFPQQFKLCRALLESNRNARKAWKAGDLTLRKLYISAFQSELFNRVVGARIDALGQLQAGDLAYKHANGACFRVEEPATEQPRADRFEISPTGPLFGKRMTEAIGEPGRIEAEVLASAGFADLSWDAPEVGKLTGARRPLRVPLVESAIEAGEDDHGGYLRLGFMLAAGSFATNVVREICKAGATVDVRGSA